MKVLDDVHVRWGIKKDFDRIVEIANSEGVEWKSEDILLILRQQWTVAIVVVDNLDYVMGFCIYHLNEDSFSICHLAVDAQFYRQGIGSRLINTMKDKLNGDRPTLTYLLPETNLVGQLFLKQAGLKSKLIKSHPEDIIEFRFEKE